MTEVRESFEGRPVLIKHVQFAFYHPAAFVLAQIIADLPVTLVQISHFSIVLYFMSGLRVSAGAFFTYWVVIFATTVCITAMFRAIASAFSTFNSANKIAGLAISAAVTYSGYIIYKSAMHPWFVWIYWINPLCELCLTSPLYELADSMFKSRNSIRPRSVDGE
jgi:ATP-binding cassette subfamily G (WHITE) protein 2 (SNQ2)